MAEFEQEYGFRPIYTETDRLNGKSEEAAIQAAKFKTVTHMVKELWQGNSLEYKDFQNLKTFRMEDGTEVPSQDAIWKGRFEGRDNTKKLEKPNGYAEQIVSFFENPKNQGKRLQILCPDGNAHYLSYNKETGFSIGDTVPRPTVQKKPSLWSRFKSLFTKVEAVETWKKERSKANAYDSFVGKAKSALTTVANKKAADEKTKAAQEKVQQAKEQEQARTEQKKIKAEKEKKIDVYQEEIRKREQRVKAENKQPVSAPKTVANNKPVPPKMQEQVKTVTKPVAPKKSRRTTCLKQSTEKYREFLTKNPIAEKILSENFYINTRADSYEFASDSQLVSMNPILENKDSTRVIASQLVLTEFLNNKGCWNSLPQNGEFTLEMAAKKLKDSAAFQDALNELWESYEEEKGQKTKEIAQDLFKNNGTELLKNETIKKLVHTALKLDAPKIEKTDMKTKTETKVKSLPGK